MVKIMTDNMTFLRNYNYDICVAAGKIWTVVEALEYLASYLTNRESWDSREDALKGLASIKDQLLGAVKQSIDEGTLIVDEEFHEDCNDEAGTSHHEIDFERSTVRPFMFIDWALANNIDVPVQFEEYADVNLRAKSGYFEGFGLKRTTIHHERCRAVAELLWSLEPEITIAEMARRSEIIKFGCEGLKYDMRTICRWLSSLKTERKPGRPKKHDEN
jgi:hypothetical protein